MKVKFSKIRTGNNVQIKAFVNSKELLTTVQYLKDMYGANDAQACDHIVDKLSRRAKERYNLVNYPKIDLELV